MRKVLEYNVTPPDGKIESGTKLVKGVIQSVANEKLHDIDELVIKVEDVYSSVKIQKSFNGIGNNTLVQIK